MCGIWYYLGTDCSLETAAPMVGRLRARGPEGTRIVDLSGSILGFTRLAINGLNPEGMQPMKHPRSDVAWVCNGEIYNWRSLADEYHIPNVSGSDCEILGELYETFCEEKIPISGLFRALDGVFAIIIVDRKRGQVVIARDPYGVRPLYSGFCPTGVVFASEIKALLPLCDRVIPFLPGQYHVLDIATGGTRSCGKYHTVPTVSNPLYTPEWSGSAFEFATMAVRESLVNAVRKRMMTERPVAALLSGGIDSSLIAALVARELRIANAPPLRTFSIGMKGSGDIAYARKVADWIGSVHTEVILTPDDFFRAIPEVIHDIESYDTTTVRASVGNWLVGKAIAEQAPECKVVFNGDGSDEMWGSYLYLFKAPSDAAFEEETTRLLTDIHYFDVLRSDRCISSHGLEPRTPFLDKQVVAVAKSVGTEWRRPIRGVKPEKWLLRKAFDDGILLPPEVLWRQKEAFSDGVSGAEKSWFQIAKEMAEGLVGPTWEAEAELQYSFNRPTTAEQFYYRQLYDSYFGRGLAHVNVPYFWMPKWSKTTDPSARTL